MNNIYEFQIPPQEVDFQYNATLAALTNVLLTTAGYNADERGFGIRDLNRNECSWVLLRLAVEMDEFPQQYDKIQVETWVEEVGRASTTRNFVIRNAKNEVIGKAISIWAMINVVTRRAQDLITLDGIHQYATGVKVEIEKPTKLLSIDGEATNEFSVKYSHIDINGHVSSMRYVEWVSDCLSLDLYRTYKIKRFEINYMNEILYGETVSVYATETQTNDFHFEIRKNGSTACKARLVLV